MNNFASTTNSPGILKHDYQATKDNPVADALKRRIQKSKQKLEIEQDVATQKP